MNRNRNSARSRSGLFGVVERLVVAREPGNAGGAKGPRFKESVRSEEGRGTTDSAARECEEIARFPAGGEDNWAELRKQPSVVAEIGPQDMLRFPIRIKAK